MTRRHWVMAIGAVVALLAVVVILLALNDGDGFSLVTADPEWRSYLAVFALIVGDAVIPILPGETTLNAASTLAAQGKLSLSLVIIAGALGAIIGDSLLFWIARRNAHRVQPQLERAKSNQSVATALAFMGDNFKVLLTLGRYVPGLRFVVNTTMGLSGRPYREFLPWSALGGVLWSCYTCLLAYWVGSALDEFPLASVVISGVVTTTIIAIVFLHLRHRRRAAAAAADAQAGVS